MKESDRATHKYRIYTLIGMLRSFIPDEEERKEYVKTLYQCKHFLESYEEQFVEAFEMGRNEGKLGLEKTEEEIRKIFTYWYP